MTGRNTLDAVTVRGFKTIKALEAFEPSRLTALIGANDPGKSNFISFFRMLSWVLSPAQTICRYMLASVYFTTMFDLFRFSSNFPDYEGAMAMPDPRSRATTLQNTMLEDIGDNRLLPYIQVHEFEALVLADPQELAKDYPESRAGVNQLAGEIAAKFKDPELINGGRATAPSKRIEQKICNYRKPSSGPIITARIGLSKLRNKCPHFSAWVDKLESLRSSS